MTSPYREPWQPPPAPPPRPRGVFVPLFFLAAIWAWGAVVTWHDRHDHIAAVTFGVCALVMLVGAFGIGDAGTK